MRKNKVKQEMIREAIDRLQDLKFDYELSATIEKDLGQDNTFTVAMGCGVQKAIIELFVLMEKYE